MKNTFKSVAIIAIITFFSSIHIAFSFEKHRQKHQESSNLFCINEDFMIDADEFYNWHCYKDKGGPTYSGSPSWHRYLNFIETKLEEYGVIDTIKNTWTYTRWHTSDWPDNRQWTIVSDDDSIEVAHYGAYSGSTDDKGVTAELIYYNPDLPPQSIQGKIIVFKTSPHPDPPLSEDYKTSFTLCDYEYLSDPETFPPLFTKLPLDQIVSADVWFQLLQTMKINRILNEGNAAGGIIVFNMSYERLAGMYTFPVPVLTNIPMLYVDRKAGSRLVSDAQNGKTASLRLLAKLEKTETYQFIGYLPGKNYRTEKDEKILLITHTDGPSISQENGAFGLLGIVAYFSHIPQSERDKTLMVFLDNRHYMPGMERAFASYDWFTKNPEARNSVVGLIAMEHLGQMEYKEDGELFVPTGMVEPSYLWTRNNPVLIDKAIKAVKYNDWHRVFVKCVEKDGIHGKPQGDWLGMGGLALDWNIPGYATMGIQGAYWVTTGRIDKYNKELFYTQVKTFTQLTGELMCTDLN